MVSYEIQQIVPRLPPAIDGVGDYAFYLSSKLKKDFQIETHFINSDSSQESLLTNLEFQSANLNSRYWASLYSLLSKNQASFVLLHYVGYGYAKRGCPKWLVNGLLRWKASSPKARLITMFHEVAASGPPWTSAFWLSGLQQQLAKQLVQMSDRILTSKHSYAELLQSYAPERPMTIPTLPVFSTVGELQNPSTLSERTRRLVIFGGRSKRSKVYQNSLEQLCHICQYLDIQQVFDIGPPLDWLPTCVNAVPITAVGCLPREEVSSILSHSIAGFFSYNPAFLGKSTIFAAYCAHRVIPVSSTMSALPEEKLQPGKHYALPDQYNTSIRDMALMQAIADNAFAWYQAHNLSYQALTFSNLIKTVSN